MESDFLEGDGVTWAALLIAIGALNSMAKPLNHQALAKY
jgi:hypothetical protein